MNLKIAHAVTIPLNAKQAVSINANAARSGYQKQRGLSLRKSTAIAFVSVA